MSDATTNETANTATNDGREQAGVHAVPVNAEATSSSAHLDLLLDVPLEATIRFGEGQLLLRDILSAAPGAIFPLDRELNAPADLLVAGRLMARGEVVVVNGNFGLRVTELAARQPLAQAALTGAPQPAPLLKE